MAALEEAGSSAASGLEERIGYRFRRPELLEEALTHRSLAFERAGGAVPDNERLEFVGDAVLDLAAARWLAQERPAAREGELSRLRAALVQEGALAGAALALGIGGEVRLGRGEERSGGREKASILAGALEALLGAVFLDGGWRAAYRIARGVLAQAAGGALAAGVTGDAKTRLQERCQEALRETPVYALVGRSGPAHRPRFVAEARLGARALGRGEGASRKQAEQAAAAAALEAMEQEGNA